MAALCRHLFYADSSYHCRRPAKQLFETEQSLSVKSAFRELCKILTERGILILACHYSTPDKVFPCHAHIIAARIASEVGISYESK